MVKKLSAILYNVEMSFYFEERQNVLRLFSGTNKSVPRYFPRKLLMMRPLRALLFSQLAKCNRKIWKFNWLCTVSVISLATSISCFN